MISGPPFFLKSLIEVFFSSQVLGPETGKGSSVTSGLSLQMLGRRAAIESVSFG